MAGMCPLWVWLLYHMASDTENDGLQTQDDQWNIKIHFFHVLKEFEMVWRKAAFHRKTTHKHTYTIMPPSVVVFHIHK